MRITCDVNILVRAAVRPNGPAGAVIELSTLPPHTLVLSEQILADVRDALHYPRIQKKFPLSEAAIEAFVAALRSVADLAALPQDIPKVVADADDYIVVATAVGGSGTVICTRDKHFQAPSVLAYCTEHGVRILGDLDLLPLLRSREQLGSERAGGSAESGDV